MYAIVETGGKQYRVSPDQSIRVETLDKKKGETVEMDKVLFYADGENYKIGKPYIEGAVVVSEVISHDRAKKIYIFKYKPKKGYRRRMGHRQNYTQIKIKEIRV